MRVDYYGQMEGINHNTRIASITYKEEEQKDIDRLLTLMKIQCPNYYNKVSLFENMITVGVDDREDYNDFVEWYKEMKKSISLWIKHGI